MILSVIMKAINKLNRNIAKYDIYELYSSLAEENNFSNDSEFIDLIKKSLEQNIKSKIFKYGKQTEKMFAYVLSNLSECELIKKEDAGEIYSNNEVVIPDFRIILKNREQLLIEVKNHHSKIKLKDFYLRKTELQELKNYSNLMHTNLKIAIFWSNMRMWTLVDTKIFIEDNKYASINIETAILNNEMSILGDYWLATNPPLELKLQIKENELSPKCLNGVIDKVELYSNGNLITDKYEQNLAFNFILFGNWQAKQYIEFNEQTDERVIVTESNPIKGNEEEQPFYMIGTLSSLISNKYKYIVNYYQSSNSNFPKITPEKLSLDIDENNYIGKILHIWRFKVNKNM